MRWSIVRLIWLRELRDQLRDRRTVLMMAGLPLLLYPVLGAAVLQFARGLIERPSIVGVVTGSPEERDFPPRRPAHAGLSPLPLAGCVGALALPAEPLAAVAGAAALAEAGHARFDYGPLLRQAKLMLRQDSSAGRDLSLVRKRLRFVLVEEFVATDLEEGRIDLIVAAPDDFFIRLEEGEHVGRSARPLVQMQGRIDDDYSRLAVRRLAPFIDAWKVELTQVRLARRGLPAQFDDPILVREPGAENAVTSGQGILDLFIRVFPFMLVMWSLAGALYPAVDICAGEKERGTMETLLITPAGREEIVLGKFLTIWVFSAGTALLNLLSMGMTTWYFSVILPQGNLQLSGLLWCVLLSLPQAALFSAISLALGAYARSSKEGQYYLMPLFIVSMPLMFLTLAPGVNLNPFYSLVPITGLALLMQRLLTASAVDQVPWLYFLPVLVPIGAYSWLALRWAIVQFHREEVLFREAERFDVGLWVAHLFRDKEPLPSTGEAFFCFTLILLLRWLTHGIGQHWPLEVHTGISLIAFVAAPALFMAVLLNSRPRDALYLRLPNPREMVLAALFAMLLLPSASGLTEAVARWLPHLLQDRHPLVAVLDAFNSRPPLSRDELVSYLLAFALLPALCEEIAFRGYLLRGLERRFHPRSAVLLSAFMFALYYMNAFLFFPAFFLGVALGILTRRSRSLLPAIFLHALHNGILILSIPLGHVYEVIVPEPLRWLWPWLVAFCLSAALILLWLLYRKPYIEPADLATVPASPVERPAGSTGSARSLHS